MQEKRIGQLSGGERNRVHLAKLLRGGYASQSVRLCVSPMTAVCRRYNVILLDEPTNDLDVETLRALEEALPQFPGALCSLRFSF